MKTVKINNFCERQIEVTNNSALGGWTGSKDALQALLDNVLAGKELNKPVEVVRIYTDEFDGGTGSFVCTHCVAQDGEHVTEIMEPRRPNEQPVVVRVVHRAQRATAQTVDLILYQHGVLATDGDNSTDADYELVSINTMPTKLSEGVQEPMTPATMWRNYLSRIPGCPAGIGGTYHEEWDNEEVFRQELAESEAYWADKARVVVA